MPPSTDSLVVSDAGPLIALGRLDLLAVLPALFNQVKVPHEVLDECTARREQDDTRRILAAVQSGWLLPCEAKLIAATGLDRGERAAIGLALELGARLLADDRAARAYAQASGLIVIGTLGILVQARQRGHVDAIAPLIERLRASGQRLSHAAVAEALALAGEVPS